MKEYIGIFGTNQINKYGYIIPTEALESALKQLWELGSPMFISHDYHRPLGWSRPFGLQILPSQVALLGKSYFPETDNDNKSINRSSLNYLSERLSDIPKETKAKIHAMVRDYLSGEEIYLTGECDCIIDNNLARKVLPSYFNGDENDKRSLVPLKHLHQIAPGVYQAGEFAIFAHRYFRRSLSQLNNLNDIFLGKLYDISLQDDLDVKIALDPHRVGLAETYKTPLELEYWWGPKFNNSLVDIPTGVTRHDSSESQLFYHGISRTEFWWHKQNGIQSLECEELRDIPSLGINSESYGCRYIHSMIDAESEKPYHLDGAIRIYREEEFIERLDVDISKSGKNTDYIKLWRIDGELDIQKWKELICDFYRDNHLPGEYLGGKDEKRINNKNNYMDNKSIGYLPLTFNDEDGVEMFISYHSKKNFPADCSFHVLASETLSTEDHVIEIIELTALELVKTLKSRFRSDISVSKNVRYIAYEDLDINFPLIITRKESSISNASLVMNEFVDLLKDMSRNTTSRMITFSIGVEYSECIVKFSFFSKIKSLIQYLDCDGFCFPEDFDSIGSWCSQQHNSLQFMFKHSSINIGSKSVLQKSGSHSIQRKFVDPEIIIIKDNNFGLKIHESQTALLEAIQHKTLTITPVNLIEKTKCSVCGTEYIDCDCSVFREKNVVVNITELSLLGFTWAREQA